MYQWIEGNINSQIVTLNSNNITLNQNASEHFRDVKYVTVGIDYDSFELAFHPVTKSELERNTFTISQIHKLSHGNTYTRISNKALCDHISEFIDKELDGIKYSGHFDEKKKLFIINLKEPMMKGRSSL